MIRIFLVDDDPSVTSILQIIIEEQALGTVCGASNNALDALEDLPYLKPDIVVVDLLMPDMDGVTFVEKAKKQLPGVSFIMLSQVSSKDMVAKAYEAGVEFFIQKPVNAIEVRQVIENVSRKQSLERTVDKVRDIFAVSGLDVAGDDGDMAERGRRTGKSGRTPERLRRILQDIGLSGELGSEDIITVVSYFCEHEDELSGMTLRDICSLFSDSPKSMEQRIRRAAAAGLSNMANLGLDDYGNEIFNEYASRLFNFQQVRKEMDFIQGKTTQHGNVRIKKFIVALVDACTE